MIPGVMIDFLDRATVAVAATRDRRLGLRVHRLSGWKAVDDKDVICLVGAAYADGFQRRIEVCRTIALTAEVIGPHETYQYKGDFVDARPADARDRALYEGCRERFVESVLRSHPDASTPEMLRRSILEPVLAVRFEVAEIFVQTPGPAAGLRLFPRNA